MVVEEEDDMLALLLKIKLRQLKYGGEGRGFFSRRERGRHSGAAIKNIVTSVIIIVMSVKIWRWSC